MPLGASISASEHPFAEYKGIWVDMGIGDRTHCGVLAVIRRDGYFILSPYLRTIHTSPDLPYRLEISNDKKTVGPEALATFVDPVSKEEVETRIKEYERSFQHAWTERERKFSGIEQKVQEEKKGT